MSRLTHLVADHPNPLLRAAHFDMNLVPILAADDKDVVFVPETDFLDVFDGHLDDLVTPARGGDVYDTIPPHFKLPTLFLAAFYQLSEQVFLDHGTDDHSGPCPGVPLWRQFRENCPALLAELGVTIGFGGVPAFFTRIRAHDA